MTATHSTPWHNRLVTFFLAAAAAASAGFWVLQWPSRAQVDRIAAPVSTPEALDVNKVAQVLGFNKVASPNTPAGSAAAASGFKLLGVIALGTHHGSALIATDALPAKPYRVGDQLSETLVLQSVSARSVVLAADMDATDGITLALPPLPGSP